MRLCLFSTACGHDSTGRDAEFAGLSFDMRLAWEAVSSVRASYRAISMPSCRAFSLRSAVHLPFAPVSAPCAAQRSSN